MEDLNTLAGDCVVICCCCQCLIAQILVFVVIKLPYRLVRRSTKLVRRKFRGRNNKEKRKEQTRGDERDHIGIHIEVIEINPFDFVRSYSCPLVEAQKVADELSREGRLAFGSFWGRKE
ncbi:uncharacterized protein [Aristolochia californica]|uniref:uncharacterized protein n=1 Tax=Aristolochia californica TaxID=171875 RepID=UPI0035DAFC67